MLRTVFFIFTIAFPALVLASSDHAGDATQKLSRAIDESERTDEKEREELKTILDNVARTDQTHLNDEALDKLQRFINSEADNTLESEERSEIEDRIDKLRKRKNGKAGAGKITSLPWVEVKSTPAVDKKPKSDQKETSTVQVAPQVKAFTDMVMNWVDKNPAPRSTPKPNVAPRATKTGLAVVQEKRTFGEKKSSLSAIAEPAKAETPAAPAPTAPVPVAATSSPILVNAAKMPVINTKEPMTFTPPPLPNPDETTEAGRTYAAEATLVPLVPVEGEEVFVSEEIAEEPAPPKKIARQESGASEPLKLTWLENELKTSEESARQAKASNVATNVVTDETRSEKIQSAPVPKTNPAKKSGAQSELEKMLQFAGAASSDR